MQTRVQNLFKRVGCQGDGEVILIHKPSNMFYFSGFTGEGLLLLRPGLALVVTDFRYTEQAQKQAPGFEILEIKGGQSHEAAAAERACGARVVRYEHDFVTVAGLDTIKKAFPDCELKPLDRAPEALRQIKDDGEIACIERACSASCEAFEWLLGQLKPGMTEFEVKLKLDFKLMELGGAGTAFSTIVASGENGSLPHAIPGERKLQKGDMITLDFGATSGGYCADMTRTVSLGEPSDTLKAVYDTVLRAQEAAQSALRPGLCGCEADAIARAIIDAAGYEGRFGHGLGHAVGLDIHEEPRLSARWQGELAPGHVVTVEPGVYLPGIGGVRIENTCVITQTGARSLVTADTNLIKL